ncbi:MAG: DUF4157 domain-containing protein [Myxococcales bacterium]|nr:DUF4157 domain-containing protein [Myxococcales bacterium]
MSITRCFVSRQPGRPSRQPEEAPVQRMSSESVPATSPAADVQLAMPRFKAMNILPSASATGRLPAGLQAGIEQLSGISASDVRVHYGSARPAELGAAAYTQGRDIFVAKGAERHLPHEAWHVIQQKQRRVPITMEMQGIGMNQDRRLESEAETMGDRAATLGRHGAGRMSPTALRPRQLDLPATSPVQGFFDPNFDDKNIINANNYITTNGRVIMNKYKSLANGNNANSKYISNLFLVNDLGNSYKVWKERQDALNAKEVIRVLNQMEEATMRAQVVSVENIKFGTEFTFTDEHKQKTNNKKYEDNRLIAKLRLNEVIANKDESKDDPQKPYQDEANRLLKAWKSDVNLCQIPNLNVNITDVVGKDQSGNINAARFEYHRNSNNSNNANSNPLVWYWILDLDDGCFETQTMPSSITELSQPEQKDIIEKHIFGVAQKLGLKPDPKIGGGHISVDVASSVGGSPVMLIDLLHTLETGYNEWQGFFKDQDRQNAPWMIEQNTNEADTAQMYLGALAEIKEGVEKGNLDMKMMVDELSKFIKQVKNPEVEKLKKSQNRNIRDAAQHLADEPVHNQAVNIEHVTDPGGQARIELRRISAQNSYQELMKQLDFISKLIEESRRKYGQ